MRLKERFTNGLLFALIFALVPITAFSAQKITAGSTCKVYKQKVTNQNKVYTCIKSGKKLVWNTGVVIVKPTPIPTTLQTPSSSPVPKVSPAPIFTPPSMPKSFNDLIKNASGISYEAWLKTSEQINKGLAKNGLIKFFVGPTGRIIDSTIINRFKIVSQLFANYQEPKETYVLIYSSEDLEWAKSIVQSWLTPEEYRQANQDQDGNLIGGVCNPKCMGGLERYFSGSDKSLILVGKDYFRIDPNSTSLNSHMDFSEAGLAHEYFHALQGAAIFQKSISANVTLQRDNWPPPYWREGGATFAQVAVMGFLSFSEYLRFRNTGFEVTLEAKKKDWLINYLDDKNYADNWSSFNGTGDYTVGMRVMEILVAIKGPEVLLDMYQEMGLGKTYTQTFEDIFGIKWSQAIPIISEVIADEYNQ